MNATPRRADLLGQRFGRLTVTRFTGIDRHNAAVWVCRCDCGKVITADTARLRRGRVKACLRCTLDARTLSRFWAKVEKTDTCWLWTGSVNDDGYGTFWYDARLDKAYRASYKMLVGPIPDGMELDHTCWNPQCVNPDHLRQATHQQNGQNRSTHSLRDELAIE